MSKIPINRLWVQFSLAFSCVILIVVVAVTAANYLLRADEVHVRRFPVDPQVRIAFEQAAQHGRNQRLLILILASGITGISAGVWMSRRMAAPLERLAEAAQAIGARDLQYRVSVGGSRELQELATAFNQMAENLQVAETLRQNLLADVAHELRTPLTVLQGNLRAILDDVYTLDKSEVARLYDQTRHLNRLVSDLHMLAQAEARQLTLDCHSIDISEFVNNIAAMFEPIAESSNVTLRVEPSTVPLIANIDAARMTQALQNLLTNALRHTPEDGTVTVRTGKESGEIRIAVMDTGAGIAPEHQSHVFDRFYRVERSRDRDSGGTGLGLAIVRALVDAHGGRINVSSPGVGRGSTFTIALPLAY